MDGEDRISSREYDEPENDKDDNTDDESEKNLENPKKAQLPEAEQLGGGGGAEVEVH